jgi:hypothetical protein
VVHWLFPDLQWKGAMQATENIEVRAQASNWARSASPVAWTPRQELDADEWAAAGRRIGVVSRSVQWLLGDWISYGNERFGERYARASRITGYDPQTLMNMVYVASRFPASRRRENLSWSHHEALAALEPPEQDGWLDQAASHRWSVLDLRGMLRLSRKRGLSERAEVEVPKAREPVAVPVVRCPRCGERIVIE